MKNSTAMLLTMVRRTFGWIAEGARALHGRLRNESARRPAYWDDRVVLTLSNLVREIETRASGRVQLISLADFREDVGELWQGYQEQIFLIVESTIGRMIGKGNVFLPHGDDAWILLMPGLPEAKAQQRADAIAVSIGQKLVGGRFTERGVPLPTASKLDLSTALNDDGSLNLEAVRTAIGTARQLQKLPRSANSGVAPAAPPNHGVAAPSAAGSLTTYFTPAWCAETESINSFFFRAGLETNIDVYANDARACSDATIIDLTKLAVAAFTAMGKAGLTAKLSIPVPFGALCGPALPEIRRLIANLPQRDRLTHLRLEVVRIPHWITADRLVPIRELFRPYVRGVALMVDLFAPHDQLLVLDHVMLGADVSTAGAADEEALFQAMLTFQRRAGRRGTYVLGLNHPSHLRQAINAGIGEIGGLALGDNLNRLPDRLSVVRREALLAR